jgi:hypothetical protein
MQFPRVNLNGTTADSLAGQYHACTVALTAAMAAMLHACPHGRDYQTLPAGAHLNAMNEHQERLERLHAIRADMENMLQSVLDQGGTY